MCSGSLAEKVKLLRALVKQTLPYQPHYQHPVADSTVGFWIKFRTLSYRVLHMQAPNMWLSYFRFTLQLRPATVCSPVDSEMAF